MMDLAASKNPIASNWLIRIKTTIKPSFHNTDQFAGIGQVGFFRACFSYPDIKNTQHFLDKNIGWF